MKFTQLILAIFFVQFLFAQKNHIVCHHFDSAGQTREHTVDFEKMILHVNFDTEKKQVLGKVHYTFTPKRKTIDSLVLDAPKISFSEVKFNDKAVNFYTKNKSIIIKFGETLNWNTQYNIELSYTTIPEKGLYFYGWDDATNRARKQIWTQGQGIDNRYWIPSFDDVSDKLLTETFITFDKGYEVISNGNLISKKPASSTTTTWHYKMEHPHVLYLVMIAIGEYEYKDYVSKRGIVSRQYYYPDRPEDIEPTYKYSAEMMDWMEKKLGVLYPWGKIYRNVPVSNFLFGAMENTTSTILTDYYLKDKRAAIENDYVSTNAHELTHQWFGDYVTEWNSMNHWLHESFATHYAKHFKRAVTSEEDYQWDRYNEMRSAFYADSKNNLPVAHSRAGSSRHYPKGSMIIDMLRDVAGGDESYRKVITSYLKKYGFKHVDTHLFQLEFMEVLGLNLNWFFDQWIYKGGFPHYKVSYEDKKETLKIRVKQIQDLNETVGVFKMPIEIDIHYKNGEKTTITGWVETQDTVLSYDKKGGKAIDFIVFDAGNKIYNKLDFERSSIELQRQSLYANHMIDRYEALKQLKDIDIKDKRKTLHTMYNKEHFYVMKAAVVAQLANDDNKLSREIVLNALKDTHYKVRRTAFEERGEISDEDLTHFQALLSDSSYVTIGIALERLSKRDPALVNSYLEQTKSDAEKNQLLKIIWLKTAITYGDKNKVRKLVDFTSNSYEFRTRISAIKAMTEVNEVTDKYIYNLINALTDFNRRLSNTASNTLGTIIKNEKHKHTVLHQIKGMTFNVNEQNRVKKFLDTLE